MSEHFSKSIYMQIVYVMWKCPKTHPQMDNGLKLQLVHVFADQRKDEHFFMALGAFNLQQLNCQFLKNVSHLLNAPHFATSILI